MVQSINNYLIEKYEAKLLIVEQGKDPELVAIPLNSILER